MLGFAADLARRAGALAMERRRTMSVANVHTKSTPADLVTDVDREVESFIVEELHRVTPEYALFGEESGHHAGSPEWCWVIDPIDGTTCFVQDLPYYCVSIALQHNGEGEVAAICAPRLGELFTAARGKGAFLNGVPLHVSETASLDRAILATGAGCIRGRWKRDNMEFIPTLARQSLNLYRCGSAALNLAYVAAGRFDAHWELALQPYDVAAGVLLVTEAGGVVSDLHGGREYPCNGILSGNGTLNAQLLPYFKEFDRAGFEGRIRA